MAGIPTIEHYSLPASGDLPDNIVSWQVDPARATLLVHDMQGYFMRPFPQSIAEPLVRNIELLRERATAAGMQLAYTAQPGGMTEEQRGLLKDFWGPGMRADATDKQIIDALTPGHDDWVLTKWRYSAFFGSDLLDRMRATGRDQLVLCGIYAHVGVLMTAIDSFTNDIETFLVADAIADFTPEFHRLAVDYAAKRCAVVTTAKEVLG